MPCDAFGGETVTPSAQDGGTIKKVWQSSYTEASEESGMNL